MIAAHVHAPRATDRSIIRLACPTCIKPRYMTAWFTPWYGWDHTCLKCGERWQDGEMCERPFVRAWRAKSVDAARNRWRKTSPHTAPTHPSATVRKDH